MLVIRVHGTVDLKRTKELIKIYKEQLGDEQPFIIVDDQVKELETYYDFEKAEAQGERFVSVFEKVENLILLLESEGWTYEQARNVAREHYGLPKLEEPETETIPLYSHEGKVADVTVLKGETINIEPGTFENLHVAKDSNLKFDELMNSGKVEITQDGGKPLGEEE